jgi:hypothetical protein
VLQKTGMKIHPFIQVQSPAGKNMNRAKYTGMAASVKTNRRRSIRWGG